MLVVDQRRARCVAAADPQGADVQLHRDRAGLERRTGRTLEPAFHSGQDAVQR